MKANCLTRFKYFLKRINLKAFSITVRVTFKPFNASGCVISKSDRRLFAEREPIAGSYISQDRKFIILVMIR